MWNDGDGTCIQGELRQVSKLPDPTTQAMQDDDGRTRLLERPPFKHESSGSSADNHGRFGTSGPDRLRCRGDETGDSRSDERFHPDGDRLLARAAWPAFTR
jgi:hypothetical protein